MTPNNQSSPWLQKYQWLIVAVTLLHMGASVVNYAARIHRGIESTSPELAMFATGAFFDAAIQGAAGFCLWLLVSGLRATTNRVARISLGLALAAYPCLCLMIPFNLVAGSAILIAEIRDGWVKRS